MNKRKRVAWHKHLKKAQKAEAKRHGQPSPTGFAGMAARPAQGAAGSAAPRR